MTFTVIQTEILERLLLTSSEASTRVGRLINKVYRSVTTELGLQTSRILEVTTTATVSSADVTFTTIEKVDRVWIKDSDGNVTVLDQVQLDELRKETAPSGDLPTRYAIRRMGANSVTIQLDQVAATGYNIFADAEDAVGDLSGNNEPAFPESFHDILIEGVLKEEYRKSGERDLAKDSKADYDERLRALRFFIAKSNYLTINK